MMRSTVLDAPIGPIQLVSDGSALVAVRLPGTPFEDAPDGRDAVLDQACGELQEYFGGHRRAFNVPVRPAGTAFQRAAWRALQDIPYGETRSYGEQAAAIGRPGAARAVGQANRRNPLPIVVPCHRVLASDGGIGGYMGGDGATTCKVDLLKLEGALPRS